MCGGWRSARLNESELLSRVSGVDSLLGSRIDGSLGFWRGYVALVGAHKAHVSDFEHTVANPKVYRLFSSEAPKKKSKNLPFLCIFEIYLGQCFINIVKFLLPKLTRSFSADYENFYPKEKKEIPKENEQKSESKGERSYLSAIASLILGIGF